MTIGSPTSSARSLLFSFVLRCTEQRYVEWGRSLHAHIVKMGCWADIYLANSIVNMYAKCGFLNEASAAFEDMNAKDVVSWNSLINTFSQQGPSSSHVVLDLFRRMRTHGTDVLPNCFTFTGVFTAAASHPSCCVGEVCGRQAHCVAIKTANSDSVFAGSSLLNMYCKLGYLSDARKLFDHMPVRNSISWASMITGYAMEKSGVEAFEVFKLMLDQGECGTNEYIFTSILSALSAPGFLEMGRQIHSLAVGNGLLSFVSVENSLLTLYAKCECMDDAMIMFNSSSNKNAITWSAMITGYAQNGNCNEVLALFSQMQLAGFRPTEFTFVGILNACSDMLAGAEGKQVHAYLLKLGFELQMYVKSALADMYAKCGSINDARKGFDELHEADVVLWTTIIGGYVQNGEHEEALSLYRRMQKEGVCPNNLTLASALRACASLAALEQGREIHASALKYGFSLGIPIGSALSTMYAKCGNLGDCSVVFKRMPDRDVVAWNSIISGFSQNGCGWDAIELFEEMRLEGTEPDHVTFINLLSACSHMGLLERGWGYFSSMLNDHGLIPKLEHYACMVDMLSRAGMFEEAKSFTESVPIDHGTRLWQIILGACRKSKNFNIGAYAGERLVELGSQDSSTYILLANIYASCKRWDDVERVRRLMRLRGINKDPGCSWIELKSRVHVFVVRDLEHPDMEDIYAEIKRLIKNMKDEGYSPAWQLSSSDFGSSIQLQTKEDSNTIMHAFG